MPAAFVNKAQNDNVATATTIVVTPVSPAPANGNTAWIQVTSSDGVTTCTLKDSNAVSYTAIDTVDDAGNGTITYTFRSPTGGIAGSPTSFTATFGSTITFRGITYIELSGVDTSASPLDGHNMATKATSTTPTSNSITTTVSGDAIIGGIVPDSGGSTVTAGGAYTLRNNTTNLNFSDETQIQGAAAAITAPFGFNPTQTSIVSITAFKAAASVVADIPPSSTSKRFSPQWNPTKSLLQGTAQDTSSSAIETNPQWKGRAYPPQWIREFALWQNPATDIPIIQSDIPQYFKPRQLPTQWNLNPLLRQDTAQDFSSSATETNPQWQGKSWKPLWNLTKLLSPALDVLVVSFDVSGSFGSKAIPVRWILNPSLWRNPAIDITSTLSDKPYPYISKIWPSKWIINPSLDRGTAQDLSTASPETNTFIIPRFWPSQWSLQTSFLRGTAQDFSFIPPIPNPAVYYILEDLWIEENYLQAGTTQITADGGGVLPIGWVPNPNVDPVNPAAVSAYIAAGYASRGLTRRQWVQVPVRAPNYVWQTVNGEPVLVKVASNI